MPLGDSITNGNSSGAVPDNSDYYVSYRKSLWDKLLAAGYDIDFVGSLNSGSAIFGDTEPADHEGHPGWTDDEIVDGRPAEPEKGNLAIWLADDLPDIVLLHIGTNGVDPSPNDVEAILDEIEDFEIDNAVTIWVILARIINRSCITDLPTSCPESVTTMNFNINVANMAQTRISTGDKIIIVDMENGAAIDYHLTTDNPPGDMWDNLHPFETGYAKMADLWFSELMSILPQADAGDPQTVKETVTVTLNGFNSSDPDGTIASYLWEQETGTPVTLPGASPNPTATFTAPFVDPAGEILTFKLTVTDDDGLTDSDDMTVTVNNVPIAPTAAAGADQEVDEGIPVTLDGTGSNDPDGSIVSYLWEQETGTPVTLPGASPNPTATFTAPDVGPAGEILTFKLTVTDDDGLTSSDTMKVNVAEPLLAVGGDDQNVTVGATVTLDGTASTGPIASYEWIQTDGTRVQLSGADTATATFTYNPGAAAAAVETLIFQLTVKDNTGLESSDTVNVNVDDGIVPDTGDGDSGGGGGGGGGCFINSIF